MGLRALQDLLETTVHQGLKELPDFREIRDKMARMGLKVHLVLRVIKVSKANRDRRVYKDRPDIMEPLGPKVLLGKLVRQGSKGHRVHQALQVQQEDLDLQVQLALPELWVRRDLRAHKVLKVLRVQMVMTEHKVLQAQLESMVGQGLKGFRVYQVRKESRESMARMDHQAQPELPVQAVLLLVFLSPIISNVSFDYFDCYLKNLSLQTCPQGIQGDSNSWCVANLEFGRCYCFSTTGVYYFH